MKAPQQPTPWIITLALGALAALQEWMRQGQETACLESSQKMFEQFITALKIAQGG